MQPRDPAAGVWLSDPTIVLPGMPKRCMWVGWETPLSGLEYQSPNRWQAERLELQHHHRAGGVLGEGLVDVQGDIEPPSSP